MKVIYSLLLALFCVVALQSAFQVHAESDSAEDSSSSFEEPGYPVDGIPSDVEFQFAEDYRSVQPSSIPAGKYVIQALYNDSNHGKYLSYDRFRPDLVLKSSKVVEWEVISAPNSPYEFYLSNTREGLYHQHRVVYPHLREGPAVLKRWSGSRFAAYEVQPVDSSPCYPGRMYLIRQSNSEDQYRYNWLNKLGRVVQFGYDVDMVWYLTPVKP